jgi:hypothetical protein
MDVLNKTVILSLRLVKSDRLLVNDYVDAVGFLAVIMPKMLHTERKLGSWMRENAG